jgi:hypothetical protein
LPPPASPAPGALSTRLRPPCGGFQQVNARACLTQDAAPPGFHTLVTPSVSRLLPALFGQERSWGFALRSLPLPRSRDPSRGPLPSCRWIAPRVTPRSHPGSRALLLPGIRCLTAGCYPHRRARCSPGLPLPSKAFSYDAMERPSASLLPCGYPPRGRTRSGVSLNAVSHISVAREQRRVPFRGSCTSFSSTPLRIASARAWLPRCGPTEVGLRRVASASGPGGIAAPWSPSG